ncbi:MAG: right-handed parallel beta-helix repeat-containing protein [Kiritimatiellia bacterium]|jgi:hypothetical protein|nr:right-handed parallel beta-helix repeat-containing protein [Kiritimatiellia bacterium]NLC79897.1 right-handed parallel beta-helix repeat-containing protein [Lentisphaerota bacterium]
MKASGPLEFCLAVSLFAAVPLGAKAQDGSLTPPGAPGRTMKTLAQVEPRTPIGSAPVTLSRPGSYYLTTNLSDTVTSNGVGIVVGEACKISACAAQRNGGVGVFAELGGAIADCTAEYNKSNGVHIAGNTMVTRCVSNNNGENGTGAGFYVTGSGNRIEGNHAFKNDRGFVTVEGANFIFRNTARWNSPNWSLASGNLCLVVTGVAAGAINGDSGGTSPGSADPNANFTY